MEVVASLEVPGPKTWHRLEGRDEDTSPIAVREAQSLDHRGASRLLLFSCYYSPCDFPFSLLLPRLPGGKKTSCRSCHLGREHLAEPAVRPQPEEVQVAPPGPATTGHHRSGWPGAQRGDAGENPPLPGLLKPALLVAGRVTARGAGASGLCSENLVGSVGVCTDAVGIPSACVKCDPACRGSAVPRP